MGVAPVGCHGDYQGARVWWVREQEEDVRRGREGVGTVGTGGMVPTGGHTNGLGGRANGLK